MGLSARNYKREALKPHYRCGPLRLYWKTLSWFKKFMKIIKGGAEIITTNTFRTNIRTIKSGNKRKRQRAHLSLSNWPRPLSKIRQKGLRRRINRPVEDCYCRTLFPVIVSLR